VSLQVRSLSFGYRNFRLHVENLQFGQAKLTSIVGRNGAGKSTFLKCLAGVLPLPGDSVFLDGKDLAAVRGGTKARLIGYVPQEHGLALNYSVLDFVLLGRAGFLSPFSVPTRQDHAVAEEALEFVGLSGFAGRSYSELSSGERRLVLIARTLAQRPDVLLMDEPTTFLDPGHEIEVLELCRRLAVENGKTVIVTLHNLEMAVKFSDQMVFMARGGI
jgi:iron complex transport system ATP-binding protein